MPEAQKFSTRVVGFPKSLRGSAATLPLRPVKS